MMRIQIIELKDNNRGFDRDMRGVVLQVERCNLGAAGKYGWIVRNDSGEEVLIFSDEAIILADNFVKKGAKNGKQKRK